MSVPVAVWNKIEALKQAHAELAAKVERHWEILNEWGQIHIRDSKDFHNRISALESPAPAPAPVCANCGHVQDMHHERKGVCADGSGSGLRRVFCDCQSFVPTAEPEPAPLDPVLVAIRDLYVLMQDSGSNFIVNLPSVLRDSWRLRTGERDMLDADCHAAIRAYGRDGAR